MEMRLEQRQLLLAGGLTETVLPETEVLLAETDYQLALGFVSRKKNMNLYESMMDFLFCEIFTKYRRSCFAYYEDQEKPRLKDMMSPEELARYDLWLKAGLNLAKQKMEEKRVLSWKQYRIEVLKLAA